MFSSSSGTFSLRAVVCFCFFGFVFGFVMLRFMLLHVFLHTFMNYLIFSKWFHQIFFFLTPAFKSKVDKTGERNTVPHR